MVCISIADISVDYSHTILLLMLKHKICFIIFCYMMSYAN